jgi:hypothetical protein
MTLRVSPVGDDRNCPHSYSSFYSSYQLPTLRSHDTESVSGARRQPQRDDDLQLQRPIKPEPMLLTSPYSKSSYDIPMAVAGSLSSQHEVVESIKIASKRQEMGTAEVSQLTTCSTK